MVQSAIHKPDIRVRLLFVLLGIVVCLLVAWLALGLYSRVQLRKMTSVYPQPQSSLRIFLTAIVTYRETYKKYPPTLSALGGSASKCTEGASAATACLIDNVLATGEKSGITYHYTLKDGAAGFTLTADSANQKNPPPDHYFTDQTGIIRVEVGRVATADSPPIKYE